MNMDYRAKERVWRVAHMTLLAIYTLLATIVICVQLILVTNDEAIIGTSENWKDTDKRYGVSEYQLVETRG